MKTLWIPCLGLAASMALGCTAGVGEPWKDDKAGVGPCDFAEHHGIAEVQLNVTSLNLQDGIAEDVRRLIDAELWCMGFEGPRVEVTYAAEATGLWVDLAIDMAGTPLAHRAFLGPAGLVASRTRENGDRVLDLDRGLDLVDADKWYGRPAVDHFALGTDGLRFFLARTSTGDSPEQPIAADQFGQPLRGEDAYVDSQVVWVEDAGVATVYYGQQASPYYSQFTRRPSEMAAPGR